MAIVLAAVVIVGALALATSVYSSSRDRNAIDQAARADTWSELTNGELRAPRQGALLTFWGAGGPRGRRSNRSESFVAIDEGAIVVVHPEVWPRRPDVAWVERADDGPVIEVRSAWLGTRISPRGSEMAVYRSSRGVEEVALDLRRRGWIVDEGTGAGGAEPCAP